MIRTETEAKCDEQWSNIAIGVVFVGVSVVAICFMWPVPMYYTIDPALSAAENEEKELELHRKQVLLYSLTCVGMAMVTMGGLITAGLFTRAIIFEECQRDRVGEGGDYWPQKGHGEKKYKTVDESDAGKTGDSANLVDSDFLASASGGNEGKTYGSLGTESRGASQ